MLFIGSNISTTENALMMKAERQIDDFGKACLSVRHWNLLIKYKEQQWDTVREILVLIYYIAGYKTKISIKITVRLYHEAVSIAYPSLLSFA